MNKQLADSLQKTLGISYEQIVREEYEMIILKALFESQMGKSFVFKGGTALRLGYGSPRFSEDLDFSIVDDFDKRSLNKLMQSVAHQHAQLKLLEIKKKYFTYFALFKVKEEFMPQTFSIKFEASTRQNKWEKEKDYRLLTLNSKATMLTVLAQAATLERIEKDKLTINPPRIRDIFDLWFIRQKLGKQALLDFRGLDVKIVRRDLYKFLPESSRRLLEQWLPKK